MIETSSVLNPRAVEDATATQKHVTKIIQDFYPDIYIARVPLSEQVKNGKPHALVQKSSATSPAYVIRYLDDSEINAELLTWIMTHDSRRQNVYDVMQAHNKAIEAIEYHKIMEKQNDKEQFLEAIVKSPLHTYRHGGKVY